MQHWVTCYGLLNKVYKKVNYSFSDPGAIPSLLSHSQRHHCYATKYNNRRKYCNTNAKCNNIDTKCNIDCKTVGFFFKISKEIGKVCEPQKY